MENVDQAIRRKVAENQKIKKKYSLKNVPKNYVTIVVTFLLLWRYSITNAFDTSKNLFGIVVQHDNSLSWQRDMASSIRHAASAGSWRPISWTKSAKQKGADWECLALLNSQNLPSVTYFLQQGYFSSPCPNSD